jgi:signal transduction histidine kinase
MRTAIEHAGAERGLLILQRSSELRIEAEAKASGDDVILRQTEIALRGVPESIVHFVIRTREHVILDDAAANSSFSGDTYIRERHARSILCLPLINQAKLIGVLYLENNLAPQIFTPNRIAVLKLLASQAAVSLENVIENRRAEEERERLRQLEADLAHINRVSTLGELTASLTHEIRQPMFAAATDATTCMQWLSRDQPNVGAAREAASRIIKDINRASDIINRISTLFKKGVPKRELVDVNGIIHEIVVLLRGEANRYGVSMRTDLAADLPKIPADRVQLQQVFMNLMLNGIEAMKETGGVLTVDSEVSQDGRLLISISDTGIGLPAEKADQIFTAFFTTKPQGTGMGLAISRSIVESHGGRLWATTHSQRGASFHFTLPTATELLKTPATGT